jgi:uncharacterized DUF497 family protein
MKEILLYHFRFPQEDTRQITPPPLGRPADSPARPEDPDAFQPDRLDDGEALHQADTEQVRPESHGDAAAIGEADEVGRGGADCLHGPRQRIAVALVQNEGRLEQAHGRVVGTEDIQETIRRWPLARTWAQSLPSPLRPPTTVTHFPQNGKCIDKQLTPIHSRQVKVSAFLWDDHNIEHISAHGVPQWEVEQLFRRSPKVRRTRDDRYPAAGTTEAGRFLLVHFRYLGHGVMRPITARDMTPKERRS